MSQNNKYQDDDFGDFDDAFGVKNNDKTQNDQIKKHNNNQQDDFDNNFNFDFQEIAIDNERDKRKKMLQYMENQNVNENLLMDANQMIEEIEKVTDQKNPNLIRDQQVLKKIIDKEKIPQKLQQVNYKLKQNPQQFRDVIKCYVFMIVLKYIYLMREIQSEDIQANIISRISSEDLEFLQSAVKNPQIDFAGKIKTLIYHFKKYFFYRESAESKNLIENLNSDKNNKFGYLQMMMMFTVFLNFFGIPNKFIFIVDFRPLDLDKNFKIQVKEEKQQQQTKKSKKKPIDGSYFEQSSDEENGGLQKEDEKLTKKNTRKKPSKKINKSKPAVVLMDEIQELQNNSKSKGVKNAKKKNIILSQINEQQNDNEGSQLDDQSESFLELNLEQYKFKKIQPSNKIEKKQKINNLSNTNKNTFETNNKMIMEEEKSLKIQQISNNYTMENNSNSIQNKKIVEEYEEASNINFKDKKQQIDDKKNDFVQDSEVKIWIEVYNQESFNILQIDPISGKIFNGKSVVQKKLHEMPILYIFGMQVLNISPKSNYKRQISYLENIYLQDMTVNYNIQNYLKILQNRRKIMVDFWWQDTYKLLSYQGQSSNLEQDGETNYFIFENSSQNQIQQTIIPKTLPEFRVSPIYTLESQLKKYQGLKPGSQALNIDFKEGEKVYLKADLVELHARTEWKKQGRTIKKDEKPVKSVPSQINQGKMVDIYGEWQTEITVNVLNEDGTLPKNEYGNFEMFSGQMSIPPGTVHINLQGLPKLCKNNSIECVEVITGFDYNPKSMRSHPIKEGILVHQKDEQQVRKLYEENYIVIQEKRVQKMKNDLKQIWRKLFKAIAIKKQIQIKYNNNNTNNN